MIAHTRQSPGDNVVWSERFIPPTCPILCPRYCDVLYGVIVWTMQNMMTQHFKSIVTGEETKRAHWVCHGWEYYFDRYGCRRTGPPPGLNSVEALGFSPFHIDDIDFPGIRAAWWHTLPIFEARGIPRPGSIRLLPKWRLALKHYSLASPI